MRTTTRTARLAAGLVLAASLTVLAGCRTGSAGPEAAGTTPPTAEPAEQTPEPEPTGSAGPTTDPTEPGDEPTAEPVVNGPNSITAPLTGEQVPGPVVTVTGEGTAFEATLSYRVLRAGTSEVVSEGWTMAGANGEVGPYSFDVELGPGEYTVEVWEPDMSDGESGTDRRNLVQVTFTVG